MSSTQSPNEAATASAEIASDINKLVSQKQEIDIFDPFCQNFAFLE